MKHIQWGHQTNQKEDNFKCISCAQVFILKPSLIKHRLDAHGKSKIKCRYKADNTCRNGENDGEKCLYDHSDQVSNDLMCNSCDEG